MSPAVPSSLDEVAAAVAGGGVVAVPTDTVYGLACAPTSAAAVERVYRVKGRPAGLELSILAAAEADLAGAVTLPPVARRLAAAFWPGPLSLVVPAVSPRRWAVPREGGTLSVRIPGHDLLRRLLLTTGPVASTSANLHGRPPCVSAAEVLAELGDSVDAVLDGGTAAGLASTIIDCSHVPPRVLRAGPLGAEQLRPYLGG